MNDFNQQLGGQNDKTICSICGSGGGVAGVEAWRSQFLRFHAVFERKLAKSWAGNPLGLAPSSGKSSIRHRVIRLLNSIWSNVSIPLLILYICHFKFYDGRNSCETNPSSQSILNIIDIVIYFYSSKHRDIPDVYSDSLSCAFMCHHMSRWKR